MMTTADARMDAEAIRLANAGHVRSWWDSPAGTICTAVLLAAALVGLLLGMQALAEVATWWGCSR